jgi:transposase
MCYDLTDSKKYIISEHKDGKAPREISKEFECSSNTIRSRLKEWNSYKPASKNENWSYSEDTLKSRVSKDELRKILENNNIQKAAENYDVTAATISKVAKHYDLKHLIRNYNNEVTESKVINLYCLEDLCMAEISRKLQCSVSPIRRILKENDVAIESAKEVNKKRRFRKINHKKNSEENNAFYGKSHTRETKNQMRKSAIKRLKRQKGQIKPNYNPKACKLIEEYGDKHGYDFQHAENGGEYHIKNLGYWVDGYDEEQNIVIEVDEPHHFKSGELRERDKRRQREIEEHLNCKFIRLQI